ncbi:MAG: fatty acid CoA ligase family protein [bacterium]
MAAPTNIAGFLPAMAAARPDAPAIVFPHGRDAHGKVAYTHYTYAQLDAESDAIARGLAAIGVGRGVRAALMVRPSLEFFALTFGLFKAGVVPVMIDPGIGLKALKTCLAEAAPEAFIGIPAAHVARLVLGWARSSLKIHVTVGRRLFWGGHTLAQVKARGRQSDAPAMAPTEADELAAILFTSGSTGVPKGVAYQHRHFVAQVELIRDAYDIRPGEIDLPTFPLFALFDPALGMTTIVPDMDATRPAQVDPARIFEAIRDFGVTNMFGSPALLNTVGRAGEAQGIELPSLRRVISAGAPVTAAVQARFLGMLPAGARIHTPYGATEALPVATVASDELLTEAVRAATDAGAGVLVGRPLPVNDVRIIRIVDGAIEAWTDDLPVPDGTIGEITVVGPTVTESYDHRPASTALAKIRHGEAIRHRMGDVGYLDAEGRLWFCGRMAHRVETPAGTLFSVPCESIFNTHPGVYRTALVGVQRGGVVAPALCVEREPGGTQSEAELRAGLLAIGARHEQTREIKEVHFHPGFPVDIRHNAKIRREALAVWAQGRG